jgi:hypothetical protein
VVQSRLPIEYHRSAISEAHAEDPRRPGYSDDFATALYSRFELRGESADLGEAIDILERAVGQSPREDPDLGSRLTNLSVALRLRFENFWDLQSLSRACEKAREAAAVTPQNDQKLPGSLSNFGSTLLEFFEAAEDLSALEEGIGAFRRALDLLPGDHALRPVILANLAMALRSRAYALDQLDDVTESFRFGDEALHSVPHGLPLMARCSYNVAIILQSVFSVSEVRRFLDAAIELARATAAYGAAPIALRLTAANAWGQWAAQAIRVDSNYFRQAVAGYAAAVSLLPTLAWRGLQRASQERLLAVRSELPGMAAAYATEAQLAEGAVALLELGRSVLWQQLLAIHTDLDSLRERDSALADRMTVVRTQLDQLSANPAFSRAPS